MNITIVSDVPPDLKYTAGQVLYNALSNMPNLRFKFYWLNQSNLDHEICVPQNCSLEKEFDYNSNTPIQYLASAMSYFGRKSRIFSSLNHRFIQFLNLAVMVKVGLSLGFRLRKENSAIIWFVVQGQKTVITYFIAASIARKNYILQQWDPLSWWLHHRNYSYSSQLKFKKLLYQLESRAKLNLVPSDAWKNKLINEGNNAFRFDNFFVGPQAKIDELVFVSDPDTLNVVFIGQLYANAELFQLLQKIVNFTKCRGKSTVLHYFGSDKCSIFISDCKIISHGFMDRDSLIKRISKWDIALLPYPMEDRFEETSSRSFPSKSMVYIAAGLPILSLTRINSAPHIYYKKKYSQYYCNILDHIDSEKFILDSWTASYTTRCQRYEFAQALITRSFSKEAVLEPLYKFLTDTL